jgi:hypothetical protein
MNKQIEEMALALSEGGCGKECDCIQGDKFNCHLLYSASVLYNAGYRKASDVAREIFELVECAFSPVLVYEGHTIKRYIAELKKKYESEGGE